MIWKIARKEFLLNLLMLRFIVGTALVLILTGILAFVLIGDYREEIRAYDRAVSQSAAELQRVMTFQYLHPTIAKPPEVLTLFSKGIEENAAKSAVIRVEEIPVLTNAGTSKNPLLAVFAVLDIGLIFKLVVSVLAFLLAYDAVSGEKEDGTLRLMLSNRVPRSHILFGKFAGGMLTMAIPITLGFLATLLVLALSPFITLTGEDWPRILLMYAVSLIMVGVFCSVGLLVSSLTKRASDSLILLLFIWVAYLLLIPNFSSYIADRYRPVDSPDVINAQIQEKDRALQSQIREIVQRIPEDHGYRAQNDGREAGGFHIQFASGGEIRFRQELYKRTIPLQAEYAREVGEFKQRYADQLVAQKKWSDALARVSPISLYENLMSALSRTDAVNVAEFSRQAREYRQRVVDYLERKKAFSSLRYFTTMPEDRIVDVADPAEFMMVRRKYGAYRREPLDLSDLPEFRYRRESPAESLKRSWPDLFLLIFTGLFFFACAHVALLKYDVR